MDNKQKCLCIIAILIAFLALAYASSLSLNESIFEIEVNNTNLAPSFPDSTGTGERVQGVTYYANETPIDIYVWAHAQSAGNTAEVHLLINGTKIQDQSDKAIGVAEQLNNSVTARIPRYANYSIEVSNYHHYEWREYRVISGQNGSVNITNNYYNITGNASGGASNSGGVSVFFPDKVINSSGEDIGNSYTWCPDVDTYCYVGITNYPNASIGDNFQSHFTTPINFSNVTIFSLDDNYRGIASLYINGVLVSSSIDFYKAAPTTVSKKKISLGGTYPPGYYNITLVVTGKNASSAGYSLHISQMMLWMEGTDNYNQSFDGVSDVNNYYFNQTLLNTTCIGCINETQLNTKVNKTGDDNLNTTGNITANWLRLNYLAPTTSANTYPAIMNIMGETIIRPSFEVSATTSTFRPIMDFKRSRGNFTNKTAVIAGSLIGDFYFDAHNGTEYVEIGNFGSRVSSVNATTGLINSILYFGTREAVTGNPSPKMVISSSGVGIGYNNLDFSFSVLPEDRLHVKNGSVKVDNLSGIGNRPVCAAANGTLIICP